MKMTTAQVVETSVTVNNNSPIQDYVHPDDETQPTFKTNSHRNHTNRIFYQKSFKSIDRFLRLTGRGVGGGGGGLSFFSLSIVTSYQRKIRTFISCLVPFDLLKSAQVH